MPDTAFESGPASSEQECHGKMLPALCLLFLSTAKPARPIYYYPNSTSVYKLESVTHRHIPSSASLPLEVLASPQDDELKWEGRREKEGAVAFTLKNEIRAREPHQTGTWYGTSAATFSL
ncbi:unnamed protein product [Orchesella dallaii]|uniref:Uncharacterized protein n=1 Tax=Orchesella dallaii TaxID=48710 RepID=A0ABP1S942_9HEXA